MRRVLSALLILALAGPPAQLSAQGVPSAQVTDPELAKGILQVDEGDFDAALITIDGAVRRLQGQASRPPRDLSTAYLYLGIAYLGLSQEQAARMRFLEAVKQNQSLQLDPKEYPPRVVQLFQDARREMGAPAAASRPSAATAAASPYPAARVADRGGPRAQVDDPAPRPAPTPEPDEGGGGSKTLLIVGGLLVVGGVAAAVALSGGDDDGDSGPLTMTFNASDVPRPIRDFTTTTSTINVTGLNGTVVNVTMNVSITHTFIGDLVVGLRSPAGTEVILHNRDGGGTANINRTFSPVGFAGQPANGGWVLRVSDEAGADLGQINTWALTITVQR